MTWGNSGSKPRVETLYPRGFWLCVSSFMGQTGDCTSEAEKLSENSQDVGESIVKLEKWHYILWWVVFGGAYVVVVHLGHLS